MKILTALLVAIISITARADGDFDTLAPKLQNVSVTIHAEGCQGSGTIVYRNGLTFILTAGHVVEGNRKVLEVTLDGKKAYSIEFSPVTAVREIYTDGRSVGTTTVEAEVVSYSSADYGDDIALLRARSKITDDSVEFNPDKFVPVGSGVVHVGSLLGQEGSNSFTTGSYSQIGRTLNDKVFDQVSCPAYPGSSGGGIFLRNGQYVGMLVRGVQGGTFNLIVPVRRIKTWAKEHGCMFLFDPKSTDTNAIRLETKEPLPPETSGKPVIDIGIMP